MLTRSLSLAACGLFLLALTACQSITQSTPPLPLPDLAVGVAPFTQPSQSVQLLAGYVPEQQNRVNTEQLSRLDDLLADKLGTTSRRYTNLPRATLNATMTQDAQGRRSALATWVQQAKEAKVDLLIVPQVIDWRDRVGGSAGVVTPAAVMIDFFLIDARGEGELLQRSHFAEAQQALASNLLSMGSFLQRKGKWVTAEDLAQESMTRAIREFGL